MIAALHSSPSRWLSVTLYFDIKYGTQLGKKRFLKSFTIGDVCFEISVG